MSNARRSVGITEEGLAEAATQRRAAAAVANRISFVLDVCDEASGMADYSLMWQNSELGRLLTGKRGRAAMIPSPSIFVRGKQADEGAVGDGEGASHPLPTLIPGVCDWWNADLLFTLSDEMIADIHLYHPNLVLVDGEEGCDGSRGSVVMNLSDVEHQVTHLELVTHRAWQIRLALLESVNQLIRCKAPGNGPNLMQSVEGGSARRLRTRRSVVEDLSRHCTSVSSSSSPTTGSPLSNPVTLGGLCEPLGEAIPYEQVRGTVVRVVYDMWLRWRGYAADMCRPWGHPLIPSLLEAVPADDFFVPVTDLRTRLSQTQPLRGLTFPLSATLPVGAPSPTVGSEALQSAGTDDVVEVEDGVTMTKAMGNVAIDTSVYAFDLPVLLRAALRPSYRGDQYSRVLQAMEVALPAPAEVGDDEEGGDWGNEDWRPQPAPSVVREQRSLFDHLSTRSQSNLH